MNNPKNPPFRSPAWLKKVREMPCEVTGWLPPSDPAHLRKGGNGGTGMKPDDFDVLPLNHELHAEQHQRGEIAFYIKYMQAYPEFMIRCVRARAREIYRENKESDE